MVVVDYIFFWLSAALVLLSPILFTIIFWVYWKHRHYEYFVKRDQTALIISFCCAAVYVMVGMPLALCSSYYNPLLYTDQSLSRLTISVPPIPVAMIFYAIIITFLMIILYRTLLLLLQIKYSQHSRQWRMKLNPNFRSLAVKYYKKLAHNNRITWITLAINCIVVIPVIIVGLYFGTITSMSAYFGLLSITMSSIVTIGLYKIGKFADFYFIRIELWFLICGSIVVVSEIAIGIVFYALDEFNFDMQSLFLFFVCTSIINMFAYCGLTVMFPIWMTKRRERSLTRHRKTIQSLYLSKSRLAVLIANDEGLSISVIINILKHHVHESCICKCFNAYFVWLHVSLCGDCGCMQLFANHIFNHQNQIIIIITLQKHKHKQKNRL